MEAGPLNSTVAAQIKSAKRGCPQLRCHFSCNYNGAMPNRASSAEAVSVKLPFLALSQRNDEGAVPAECPNCSGYALAFTSLVDAGSYLQPDRYSEFELELVFRQSLDKYLDAVERGGLLGVTFDAKSKEATTLTVAELRATLAS